MSKVTPAPGNIIGGQRKVVNKRTSNGSDSNGQRQNFGPGGLYRLFKDEATGVKLTPQAILVTALIYIGSVVVLHITSRLNAGFN